MKEISIQTHSRVEMIDITAAVQKAAWFWEHGNPSFFANLTDREQEKFSSPLFPVNVNFCLKVKIN